MLHEWQLKLFFSPRLQTWSWTVGQITWRWCGQRADPRLIPRSFAWGAVFPPASRPERLFSVWVSMIVTSGDWWVAYVSLQTVSPLYSSQLSGISLPCRLLGISSCTPMTWPTCPLLTLTLWPPLTQLSVHMRGGCSHYNTESKVNGVLLYRCMFCAQSALLCAGPKTGTLWSMSRCSAHTVKEI